MNDAAAQDHSTCDLCGRSAVAGAAFEVTAYETGVFTICPECRYKRVQQHGADRIKVVIFLGVLFWLATIWSPQADTARLIVNVCAGWLMMCGLILPHEFAHALTARWLGLGTGKVHAGYGPIILHGRLFGFRFLWRAVPLGGFLEFGTPARPPTLPRLFLVYAAGPGSHLAMAGVAWLAGGRQDLSGFDPMVRIEWAWLFIGANLVMFLNNMRPLWGKWQGGEVVSDGLAMAQIVFFRRKPFVPEWRTGRLWLRLRPLMVCAAVVLLMGAILGSHDPKSDLLRWLYLAGSYVCWTMATSMCEFRYRLQEDKPAGGGGGCIHTQVHRAAAEQVQQEVEALGAEAKEVIRQIDGLRAPAEIMRALERLAVKYPDSFLPSLSIAGQHLQRRDWGAAQTAYEACLRHELPSPVYVEVLSSWLATVSFGGTLHADSVRERIGDFRYTNPRDLELCCVLDAAATRVIEFQCTDLLPDAEEWTAEMMRIAPGEVTVAGTRGSVLIERDHIPQGELLLRDVVNRSTSDNDQAIALVYLAIAAKQKGAKKEAITLAGRARALLDAESGFVSRLQQEFPAPARAN